MRVEVNGAEDFYAVSKALKAAGRTAQRKELTKALKVAAKPLVPDGRAALAAALPSGLRAKGKRTKLVVQVKTGRDPGITIGRKFDAAGTGVGWSNARLINDHGRFRHPVFGDDETWLAQSLPGGRGWFDDTMRRGAPKVRGDIEAAMVRILNDIVREARSG